MNIRAENIGKTYYPRKRDPVHVLEGVNLTVPQGDFVVILGESGCGKSTLLGILAGLLKPTTGQVCLERKKDWEESAPIPDHSRSILFQQPTLLPWLTVEENIAFGCRIRGDKENLSRRVARLLETMGLAGKAKVHPPDLSAGQAQRVCLARALIGGPEVLLLDEPFSALDTFGRAHLQEMLVGIWLREGFTVVFVTHDIEEALLLGRRVIVLGGAPCGVADTLMNDLEYPRDAGSENFFKAKTAFLERVRPFHPVAGAKLENT